MALVVIFFMLSFLLFLNILLYTFFIPSLSDKPIRPNFLDQWIGMLLYITALVLTIARLPVALLAYSIKMLVFVFYKKNYKIHVHSNKRLALNLFGDILLLIVITSFVLYYVGSPEIRSIRFIFYLPVLSELIRIITEHTQIAFSAVWQHIPHRRIALALNAFCASNRKRKRFIKWFDRYRNYYALSDEQRAGYISMVLKQKAILDVGLSSKLAYVQGFQLFSNSHLFRTGLVRDVVHGMIFINESMTTDPWLLIGLAIRRSPWIFDPRFLRRPFYYRTESAPHMTITVLTHARYSIPFSIYQFGHEIKSARYTVFYVMLHCLGIHIEEPVREDGTYKFDQFLCWLEEKFGIGNNAQDKLPICNEDEMLLDIERKFRNNTAISLQDIATMYNLPMKYMDEVLKEKLNESLPPSCD